MTTHDGTPSDTTVAHALDAVDFEITEIRQNRDTPGWTMWAILPAIAGLLWLLLSQVAPTVSGSNALRAYLVISLVLQLLGLLASLIKGDSSAPAPSRRLRPFRLDTDLSAGRLPLALMLPLLLFEWWIALFLWPGVPRSALIVVSVYFGLIFLMLLLTLVLRAFNIIVAAGRPRGTSPTLLALAGILLWPTICFVTALAQQRTVSVAEWKIAGLLAALAFLLSILSRLIEDPPLLGSLIALRRDIALGRVEVEPALRQLDFIIAGMQPSDMLEREVEKLLTLLREQTEELRAIVTESNAMRVAIVEAAGREQTLLAKDDIGRWYKPHQASLTARAEAAGRELDKYYRRARWLVAGDPVAKAKGNDIRTRISEEINALSQQGAEMRNSVDALLRETLAKRETGKAESSQAARSAGDTPAT